MNLTKISGTKLEAIYDVDFDDLPSQLPISLRLISFKAVIKNKKICKEFLVKINDWLLFIEGTDIKTFIQLNELELESSKELVLICSNMQIDLIILPKIQNETTNDELDRSYLKLITSITKASLDFGEQPYIFPVHDCLHHEINCIIKNNNLLPLGCILSKFYDYNSCFITEDFLKKIKKSVLDVIHEEAGGRNTFEAAICEYAKQAITIVKEHM